MTAASERAAETETSSADGFSAERTGNQAIKGALKGLFRRAISAVTRRTEVEEPPPEKRRKGETEGEFQRFARSFARRFNVRAAFRGRATITRRATMPEEVFSVATCYLQNTFDQLSALNDTYGFIEDYGESLDGPQDILSLDL